MNIGRFSYTGQITLPELGLYHYKARVYSPTLGRFLQTDPIGYEDQINLYAYVGNDPVNAVDPLGLASVCATNSGSRTRSCVNVDGNGDGDSSDNDLTSRQKRMFARDFRNFIIKNNGADLSSSGVQITNGGDASSNEVITARVTSQFVGFAIYNAGWQQVSSIKVHGDKGTFGYVNDPSICGGGSAPACVNFKSGGITITGQRATLFSGTSFQPSHLARLFIHETLELKRGSGFGADQRWQHIGLDQRAIEILKRNGLDGGGCPGSGSILSKGFDSC